MIEEANELDASHASTTRLQRIQPRRLKDDEDDMDGGSMISGGCPLFLPPPPPLPLQSAQHKATQQQMSNSISDSSICNHG